MSQQPQQTLPSAPDSPALVVTSNVQKYAMKKKKVLSAEETELFELTQAAGITVDQEVFKIIVDLLKMNVAPQAVFQTLKAMCAGQRVADSCGGESASAATHTTGIGSAPTEARESVEGGVVAAALRSWPCGPVALWPCGPAALAPTCCLQHARMKCTVVAGGTRVSAAKRKERKKNAVPLLLHPSSPLPPSVKHRKRISPLPHQTRSDTLTHLQTAGTIKTSQCSQLLMRTSSQAKCGLWCEEALFNASVKMFRRFYSGTECSSKASRRCSVFTLSIDISSDDQRHTLCALVGDGETELGTTTRDGDANMYGRSIDLCFQGH
ncbi:hypothetical protein F2P81_009358 [Scophthalmus maximus]|uniref:Mitotic-spindle organizing protein 2-like n=1 Tax=Scophthalmus maximus TaxID=52904 RepID=A0A6A4T6S8_SCOMX|nr:hypothetical protein F2P81_009358 [Scophthalmus maximus]